MKEFNTHHRRVTPYHPMANGEVERFNCSLKKCIQTAISHGLDWRTVLQNFLLNYRNTEHATTDATPAELFFKRQLRDKLLSIKETTQQSKASKIATSTDKARKAASKCYIDEKRKACEHNIQVGQKVLVTNTAKHRSKYTPLWIPTPKTVTAVKGNSITMNTNKGKETMRSSCQVKRYYTDPINTLLNPTINNSDDNTESESESAMSESDPDKTLPYQIPEDDDNTETHELLSSS